MRKAIHWLGSIWLKEVDERRYAWVRVAFGFVVVLHVLHLWPYRVGLLSSDGVIDGAAAVAENPGIFFSVFGVMSSPFLVSVVFLLAAAAALLLVAGIWTRVMTGVIFVFLISVTQRAPISIAGWDYILTNFAFVLLFSPLAADWNPARLWKSRKDPLQGLGEERVPRYGLVLLQVQVAIIYWQAVFQRWDDPYWRDGEFLTYFLLSHHGRFSGELILGWHDTFELLTHFTMLLELALPVLLWMPSIRILGVILGVMFHLGIAVVSVNIALFSVAMLMTYVAFLGGVRDRKKKDEGLG